MQHQPDILKIPRGHPKAAIRAFVVMVACEFCPVFFAACQLYRSGFLSNGWRQGLLLFACGLLIWHVVRRCRIFAATFDTDTFYLEMDASGLSWSLPVKRQVPWSRIEACACRNEKYRTTLRIFRMGRLRAPVDIDFALAAQSKQSLDQALVACAAWIEATRDPSITGSPIREFNDKLDRSSWASRPPKPAFQGFIAAVVSLSLVAVVVISAVSTVHKERRCWSSGETRSPRFYDWCETSPIQPSH